MLAEALGPSAVFVLDTSLRAAAAAGAVGVVLLLLRVRAADVRHTAWTAVLAAMLLMPVLPAVVPDIEVPLPVSSEVWSAGPPARTQVARG